RGVEVGAIWYPAPGWRAALANLRDDQFYTDYVEQLSLVTPPGLIPSIAPAIASQASSRTTCTFGYLMISPMAPSPASACSPRATGAAHITSTMPISSGFRVMRW